MTEAVIITNEELAILCDLVAGWSVKRSANLNADKTQALDRLIANGFVEPVDELKNTNTRPKLSCFSPNSALG
jgi:hypothetical protein